LRQACNGRAGFGSAPDIRGSDRTFGALRAQPNPVSFSGFRSVLVAQAVPIPVAAQVFGLAFPGPDGEQWAKRFIGRAPDGVVGAFCLTHFRFWIG